MEFGRVGGDAERASDDLVRSALREKVQHLDFAGGEVARAVVRWPEPRCGLEHGQAVRRCLDRDAQLDEIDGRRQPRRNLGIARPSDGVSGKKDDRRVDIVRHVISDEDGARTMRRAAREGGASFDPFGNPARKRLIAEANLDGETPALSSASSLTIPAACRSRIWRWKAVRRARGSVPPIAPPNPGRGGAACRAFR